MSPEFDFGTSKPGGGGGGGGGGGSSGGFFVLNGLFLPPNDSWEAYMNSGGTSPQPGVRFPVPSNGKLTSFTAIIHGGVLAKTARVELMINGALTTSIIGFLSGETGLVKRLPLDITVQAGDLISFDVTTINIGPDPVNCYVDAVVTFEKA